MARTMRSLWRSHPAAVAFGGLAALLALAVVGVLAARVAGPHDGEIPANVSIGGVEVGGMSVDEARRAVTLAAEPDSARITIEGSELEGGAISVPTKALAPTPAIGPAITQARNPRSWWGRLRTELGFGESRQVDLSYDVGEPALRSLLREVRSRVNQPPKPARVVAEDGIRAVPGAPGLQVRTRVLERRLRTLSPVVELPVARVPSPVNMKEAQRVAARARALVSGGVEVEGAGRSVQLTAAELRSLLRFPREGQTLRIAIDQEALGRELAETFSDLVREPRSAGFRVAGESVQIVPSQDGRELRTEPIAEAILRDAPGGRVRARFAPVEPQRTTAEARAMGIRRKVSSFTTTYACCQPRVENIQLAASLLDGQILSAGARFSLNEVLGERTEERGFVAAPQISENNELEDAVGGGVSQIATTIFNAAWFAGLEIETHMPHTFYISRYPLGREATVSWGGPELVFVNDWPAAVLITAAATDTSVTISFYSSPLGRRVETETVEVAGNDGAPGARYSRTVFEGDAVKREDTYTWAYDPPPEE